MVAHATVVTALADMNRLYADTVDAPAAHVDGGQAVPVPGGYRVNGRWTFGSGCREATWMLGSFQILDGGEPRRRPDRTGAIGTRGATG